VRLLAALALTACGTVGSVSTVEDAAPLEPVDAYTSPEHDAGAEAPDTSAWIDTHSPFGHCGPPCPKVRAQ